MNAITPIPELSRNIFSHIETDYDAEREAMWCWLQPEGRPCFTPGLLDELAEFQRILRLNANPAIQQRVTPTSYMVLGSRTPGVFSLGGDLELFASLIEEGDEQALLQYAQHSINILFLNAVNYKLPITTIALLQGDAIGAGLETALSCDIIIAERGVSMGFPEVLFNLFPGMGAHIFLVRHMDLRAIEEMILSGRIYTAEEMYDMGIIDILVDKGDGVQAANELIDKRKRRKNIHNALNRARQVVNPVSRKDLMAIAEIWVDAAMQLGKRDIRIMQRLLRAQQNKVA